jgi:mercuric ion transport protein
MHLSLMAIKDQSTGGDFGRGPTILAIGGLLGALAAASCCIMPLVLFGLGVSGAWIGNLTGLAPYQPIFITTSLACLGAGAWLTRRESKRPCAEGEACARPLPNRLVKTALIVAAVLVVAAISFDFLGPLFLNS